MKYNVDNRWMNALGFRLNLLKQESVTVEKTLNEEKVILRTVKGYRTMIINTGTDKCGDGTMFSILCCTRKTQKKSLKRRRHIVFMSQPATDTTLNMHSLLDPIRAKPELLKNSSSLFTIKTEAGWIAIVLTCYEHMNFTLNVNWMPQTSYKNAVSHCQ